MMDYYFCFKNYATNKTTYCVNINNNREFKNVLDKVYNLMPYHKFIFNPFSSNPHIMKYLLKLGKEEHYDNFKIHHSNVKIINNWNDFLNDLKA